MTLYSKNFTTILCATTVALGLSLSGVMAGEADQHANEAAVEPALIEVNDGELSQEELRAERTGSCEEFSRVSAHWQLTVAVNHPARHTPCVSGTSTRIRRSDSDGS